MQCNSHTPVMLDEVLSAISPVEGGKYIDATFGGGGHSSAMLKSAKCFLWGMDRDWAAVDKGKEMACEWDGRLEIRHGAFGQIADAFADVAPVDGVLFDVGMSSMQLDDPSRGFSVRHEAALDMRMDAKQDVRAYDVVNGATEKELADIFFFYGEERRARTIARHICKNRPVQTTTQLARICCKGVSKWHRIHPATKVFQALRIHVNDELQQLEDGLEGAILLLKERDGVLAVLSFHSLEDRLVKRFFQKRTQMGLFRSASKKPLTASVQEIDGNRRARSAKLRFGWTCKSAHDQAETETLVVDSSMKGAPCEWEVAG